jgi:hypothetical protein
LEETLINRVASNTQEHLLITGCLHAISEDAGHTFGESIRTPRRLNRTARQNEELFKTGLERRPGGPTLAILRRIRHPGGPV